jgi:predicted DNA-binding WGR domain protein
MERKKVLFITDEESWRAKFYALLSDYFEVILVNQVSHWGTFRKVLEQEKPDLVILNYYTRNLDTVSIVQDNQDFNIIISIGREIEPKLRKYFEKCNSKGFFEYQASSDELLKTIEKIIGLPKIKDRRYFIFEDEKSKKHWSIEIEGASFIVNFGKLGSSGQKIEKTFETEEDCNKEYEKLINKKLKEGYLEQKDRKFINGD